MWVADYVLMEYGTGAIMAVPGHDERDHDFATTFDLPIRQVIDCGDELPCSDDGPIVNSHPDFDGMHNRDALEKIVDWLDDAGQGPPLDQLPPARLAALAPALLGLPDPDRLLRRVRDGPGPRGAAAGPAARRRGLRAARAARRWPRPRTGSTRRCPRCGGPPAARRTRWTPSSTPPGTSCATRTPTTTRRRGTRRSRPLDAGRPVHRRRRARDPAPDVRALLREGARGHGAAGGAGALRGAVHAGHDHPRRGEDVQVQGQHDQPRPVRRALRRGHRPLLHPLHRPARPRRGLDRQGRRGRPPLPRPPLAPGRRRGRLLGPARAAGPARRPRGRRPGADAQGALGDRQGHRGHGRPLRVQHRDRGRDGAGQRGLPPPRGGRTRRRCTSRPPRPRR